MFDLMFSSQNLRPYLCQQTVEAESVRAIMFHSSVSSFKNTDDLEEFSQRLSSKQQLKYCFLLTTSQISKEIKQLQLHRHFSTNIITVSSEVTEEI